MALPLEVPTRGGRGPPAAAPIRYPASTDPAPSTMGTGGEGCIFVFFAVKALIAYASPFSDVVIIIIFVSVI